MPDRTDREKIDAIMDALGESIIDESDDEILQDLRQAGIDPEAEAARMKAMMLDTVKAFRQRHLRAAREGYEKRLSDLATKSYQLPSTPQARRDLFVYVTKQPQYAELLTAHRDLKSLTDNDIETYLEDLAELGVLEKLKTERDG
jgi:hypothetical protein